MYRTVLKIKDLFSLWIDHCCLFVLFMTKIQPVQFSLKLRLCLVNPATKQPHTPTEVRTPPLGVIRIVSGCTTGMENRFCVLRLYFCVGPLYRESGAAGVPRNWQAAIFKFSAFANLTKDCSAARSKPIPRFGILRLSRWNVDICLFNLVHIGRLTQQDLCCSLGPFNLC